MIWCCDIYIYFLKTKSGYLFIILSKHLLFILVRTCKILLFSYFEIFDTILSIIITYLDNNNISELNFYVAVALYIFKIFNIKCTWHWYLGLDTVMVRQKKSGSILKFYYFMFSFLVEERKVECFSLNVDKDVMIMSMNKGRADLFLTWSGIIVNRRKWMHTIGWYRSKDTI